jgi:lipid-A-disaccharide synthase
MRYYIIAGEASGDLHASNLIRELKCQDPGAQFRCWGGDLMEKQGATLIKHYRDLAFMGFAEVVSHLPAILRNFRFCEKDLLDYLPDVLILVDYPGFNLKMAGFAAKHGIRVFYYISPQLWAWRSSRVHSIKRWVERMFVILPFEAEFYAKYNYPVEFHGHPLLDVINEKLDIPLRHDFLAANNLDERPIIALLPGSRKMEIEKMLRIMATVGSAFPDHRLVVAGAPSVPPGFYDRLLKGTGIGVVTGQTYALLSHAAAALVTSGTATLETALIGTPQVVCYRGSPISYMIARRLVHIDYISLVNLICGRPVVPELIQDQLTPANLGSVLDSILKPGPGRENILSGYDELRSKLGGPGASQRIARHMVQYLQQKHVISQSN